MTKYEVHSTVGKNGYAQNIILKHGDRFYQRGRIVKKIPTSTRLHHSGESDWDDDRLTLWNAKWNDSNPPTSRKYPRNMTGFVDQFISAQGHKAVDWGDVKERPSSYILKQAQKKACPKGKAICDCPPVVVKQETIEPMNPEPYNSEIPPSQPDTTMHKKVLKVASDFVKPMVEDYIKPKLVKATLDFVNPFLSSLPGSIQLQSSQFDNYD